MRIDDKTAKKIEEDWVASQPIHVLLDLRGDRGPTRFSHFAWLWSNSMVRFWWVLPYGFGGALLCAYFTYYLLTKWSGSDLFYESTFLYLAKAVGLLVGIFAGWRLHGQ